MSRVRLRPPPVEKPAGAPSTIKAKVKVNVLRCRDEHCGGLLAFEETDQGYLLGRVLELADEDGEKRFLSCPKCGGRQLVEEYEDNGKLRVRVHGFEPGKLEGEA
jgi:hypothetical protein